MKDTARKRPAMASIGKHRFSVMSGALACLASVLGKVAFDGDTAFHLMATTYCDNHLPLWVSCNMVGLAVQGASLAGMFMVNAVMLSTFLKALQNSGSTIATVTNCGTNFLLAGVSGRILFGERLPPTWFCGATLVIAGVLLMVGSTDSSTGSNTNRKRDVRKGDGAKKISRIMDYSPPRTRSKRRQRVSLMFGSTDSSTNSNTEGKPDDKKTGGGANKIRRNIDYSPPKTRSKRD